MRRKLVAQLMKHEGVRFKPYRCSAGKLTIGVGRNLEENGLSESEVMFLLNNDIDYVTAECETLPYWHMLNETRRMVLVDMAFNLGFGGLMKFKKMHAALKRARYEKAAVEMLDSKWRNDVGYRANNLAVLMRRGK